MTRPLHRLVVSWPRLGPYHLARLRAAHALGAEAGVEVVAMETAGDDATYAWQRETGGEPFRRETLFPGETFEALTPAAVRRAVDEALDRLDPDAVAITSYATPDARAALAWCRRRRRAAILMSDTTADDAPRSRWREGLKARIVRQYDAALVAGGRTRAYVMSLGMPSAHIFAPVDVVDNAHFARGGSAPLPGPYFLAAGRMVERKGFGLLLDAYARYRREAAEPWPLVLVGDGPERAALEARAGEGVRFPGFAQIDALPAWYAHAGAFVHPAARDQWGLVVNEAMAAGLPVLVSRGAGCADDLVREGENGWTFAPADAAALADGLARIAGADRAAMGEASRRIIARYRPEDFAAALLDAARAGLARADRGMAPAARLALGVLRLAARRVRAFHTVDVENA